MPVSQLLIILGLGILILGLVLQFAPWLISWFGKLPGDVDYRTQNTIVLIPFTSMIILSLFISLLIRWLGK